MVLKNILLEMMIMSDGDKMVKERYVKMNDYLVKDIVEDKNYSFDLDGFLEIINEIVKEDGDEDESL